ncbi:MAG: hypothetical protein QM682_10475 [Paracoccus sp. (in: a-proteobacteria)]|uniref:hypothetical protein n=1 Tax=Paracoccus sp. TaxID=267 RepID=UPI0039E29147
MKFRSAFAVLSMTVALTACGELPFQKKSEEPAAAPAHSGPPGVSPLEQPIETGAAGQPVATAEASTVGTAMFRAGGAGWTVTAADKTAVYERAGAKSVGVTVRRMVYGRGVEFVGTMNGAVFSLNVRAQECDTGSGKAPFSALLRVGSQRLSGCAVPTDTMPKAQTKASSAPPAPKATPKAAPSATAAPAAKPAVPKPAEEPAATTPAASTPAATEPATPAPVTTAPVTPAPATTPATPEPAATTSTSTTPEPAAPTTPETAAPETPAPAPVVLPPTPETPSQ